MGGGVAPWEYLVPPLAVAHTAYNRVQNTAGGRKWNMQGSKNEKADANARHNQEVLGEQRADADRAAETLRYNTTPQTPQEELAARRRAQSAKQALGSGSASQQLTGTLG